MTNVFGELCERTRGEMPDLERVAERALRVWAQAQQTPGEHVYLDSVALNLHAFYSGVERLFELIARHVDRVLPSGETRRVIVITTYQPDPERWDQVFRCRRQP